MINAQEAKAQTENWIHANPIDLSKIMLVIRAAIASGDFSAHYTIVDPSARSKTVRDLRKLGYKIDDASSEFFISWGD